MKITVVRDPHLSDVNGTFGTLTIDTDPAFKLCTVEQPWNDNVHDRSCIPVGDYDLLPYNSPTHGATVVFHNPRLGVYGTPNMIPSGKDGRSLCEIHAANWPSDLKGCLAPGREIAVMGEKGRGVTSSRDALADLMQHWGNRSNLTASIADG